MPDGLLVPVSHEGSVNTRCAPTIAPPYAREIKAVLSPATFAPALSRVLWLPVHLLSIGLSFAAISSGLPWPLWPVLSLVIGTSFAGLSFLGHETLHGAVVRDRRVRSVVGWIGWLPFVVSPRLWVAWHNRLHHRFTNRPDVDPDAYPTLENYHESPSIRAAIALGPGEGRWTLPLAFAFGFSVQSLHVLASARRSGLLSSREQLLAVAETALGCAVWLVLAISIGPLAFLFAFFFPLLVANAVLMSFILTNHSLSPLTGENDALVNSLSVTVPRWADWLTLGFGYHVEHHIFPAMSARHGAEVRAVLLARWPERYQSLPLGRALVRLHRTARVYKNATTLVSPRTGEEWPTLSSEVSLETAPPATSERESSRKQTMVPSTTAEAEARWRAASRGSPPNAALVVASRSGCRQRARADR
jgi:fatty acid desaturase